MAACRLGCWEPAMRPYQTCVSLRLKESFLQPMVSSLGSLFIPSWILHGAGVKVLLSLPTCCSPALLAWNRARVVHSSVGTKATQANPLLSVCPALSRLKEKRPRQVGCLQGSLVPRESGVCVRVIREGLRRVQPQHLYI